MARFHWLASVMVAVSVLAGHSGSAQAQGLPYPSYSGYDIKGSGGEPHDNWFVSSLIGNYGRGLVTNAFWPAFQPSLQTAPCNANQTLYDGYCFTNDASLDWLIKSFSDSGARVTLILVGVPGWAASPGCTQVPWCGTSAAGVAHYGRFAGYIAKKYNGLTPGQGRAVHFIVQNEVNSPWAYYSDGCTSCTVASQVGRYAADYNAAYDRIKAEQAAAKVLTSFTFYYSGADNPNPPPPGGFTGITIPTFLNTFAPLVGSRAWQVALHAYTLSNTSPVFDVTDPQMTPGSMGQLVGWLRRQFPSTPSAWEIHLTEQGFHGNVADNGAQQAAWLCEAFRNVLGTPGVESFLYTPPLTHVGFAPSSPELVGCSATIPSTGNCDPSSTISYRWSWQTWALANRIDVGMLSCGFENLPYTKLSRYYNGSRGHLATTRRPPAGSTFEGAWKLFRYQQAATHPIYECEVGSAGVFPLGHTFVDRSYTCGGLKPMGPLGYAYDSPGAGRSALLRCFINAPGWATHFVSTSPTCEGWVVEDVLGYVEAW